MARANEFPGFSKKLVTFLGDLDKNNKKAWFDAHRDDYEALYLEPAKQFVEAMGKALPAVSKQLRAEPRINGSIRRINRDVRFSKDKRPYKAWLHLTFWEGDDGKTSPAFHFGIEPTSAGMGAGLWAFTPEQLARYREAVSAPAKARALRAAIAKVTRNGMALREPDLKKVPRGFDAAAPHADLLRYKGMVVHTTGKAAAELFGPGAVAYCIAKIREMRPLHKWLVDNVA